MRRWLSLRFYTDSKKGADPPHGSTQALSRNSELTHKSQPQAQTRSNCDPRSLRRMGFTLIYACMRVCQRERALAQCTGPHEIRAETTGSKTTHEGCIMCVERAGVCRGGRTVGAVFSCKSPASGMVSGESASVHTAAQVPSLQETWPGGHRGFTMTLRATVAAMPCNHQSVTQALAPTHAGNGSCYQTLTGLG